MAASSASKPVKVNRLDFHRRADGVVLLSTFQLARKREEQIAKPSPAELTVWAGYAAATVFLARKGGIENDGMNPAGLSTIAHIKRIPPGQLLPPGDSPGVFVPVKGEQVMKTPVLPPHPEVDPEGVRVASVLVWDKADGAVGVEVVGAEQDWEHTQAGRVAQAVAALMSA